MPNALALLSKMKNIHFILLIFLGLSSNAQLSVESSFNSVHIGRNQNLLVKYQIGRVAVNWGVKYNFNKLSSFPHADIFKKSFWARTNWEHIGFETGLQIKILQLENFDLFGFYQLLLTKSHIRLDFGSNEVAFSGPWWAMENNLGLGLNVYCTKSLYFTQKLGLGMALYQTFSKPNPLIQNNAWEFSEMLSFGLGWRFVKNRR